MGVAQQATRVKLRRGFTDNAMNQHADSTWQSKHSGIVPNDNNRVQSFPGVIGSRANSVQSRVTQGIEASQRPAEVMRISNERTKNH